MGEGSSLRVEACEISRNGHFGIVVGPGASRTYVGRTNLSSNIGGSIWHCGRAADSIDDGQPLSLYPLWLDECSLSGAGAARKATIAPAIVIGHGAEAVLWDSLFAQSAARQTMVRTEAFARVVVAGDGSGPSMSGWGNLSTTPGSPSAPSLPVVGSGETVWLDVSGAAPPVPPSTLQTGAAQRPVVEFPPRSQIQQPARQAPSMLPPGQLGQVPMSQVTSRATPEPGMSVATPPRAPQSESVPSSAIASLPVDLRRQSVRSHDDGGPQPTPADAEDGALSAAGGAVGSEMPLAQSEGETEHLAWLRSKMSSHGAEVPSNDQNRKLLFQLLAMLAAQNRCQDVLDSVGLGGQIKPADAVFLRGHTGRWFGIRNSAIVCIKPERASATAFTLDTRSSSVKHESKVCFRLVDGPDEGLPAGHHNRIGVTPTFEVRAVPRADGAKDADTLFVVLSDSPGPIMSGMTVYLKSVGSGRTIDVEGDAVRARSQEMGTHQRISIEKMPPDSGEVPAACPDLDLTPEEKAWLFRRGVQMALVDRQQIAKFLSSHRPTCKELLKVYTRLWEGEWRRGWSNVLRPGAEAADDSGSSPASRSTRDGAGDGGDVQGAASSASGAGARPRAASKTRKSKRDWIFSMVSSVSTEDKNNGNLFISALRSFFATALRMSQLEADPVQRVIEAFAEALVGDAAFLECFASSMLPEAERKTYRTPDEVLFGLTYTTLMLNTDLHNKQVGQKMWDTKKFVGAGKDCGVTGGLMMQIFKNVQKEEL